VGSSFYFRVNNVDVFAGGSCWIPADNFLSRISPQRYHDWVRLLVEGNQAMVRVWGGGIYEHDSFFDACDELGLLAWHDFQFACGNYPTYKAFLSNVEGEARDNIRRLRHHPSLVIWAGNNEDYETVQERYKLDYNPDDKDPQSWLKSTFPARYIYESLLPETLEEEHPGMIYLPSSPWSGNGGSVKDRTVGDAHEWNLWHGAMVKIQDIDKIGGKFVSEFGMQGYPHMETLQRAITQPKELFPGSMTMEFHNKAIGHSWRMAQYLHENFRLPADTDLASFAHLTQVIQAEAMRWAYKSWRMKWNDARECGGILVWQLNDCWPGISWAVVDYYLVKKPAYYAISRALRPLDISISRSYNDWTHTTINPTLDVGHIDPTVDRIDGGEMHVWISSCKAEDVTAEVEIRFISTRTGRVRTESPTQTSAWSRLVRGNNTTDCGSHRLPATEVLPEANEYDPYVVLAILRVGGEILADDIAWPQPIKYLDLTDRRVSVSYDGANVVVSAENPIKGFVFDEVEGMELSDNGFDVVPGLDRVVSIRAPASVLQLGYRYVGGHGSVPFKVGT
jgi:beta-mannosidase